MAGVGSDKPEESADTIPADEHTQPSRPPEPRRSSPTLPPPPGQERYQLGSELGRGGMGRVVEAYDIQLGRTVALKEVLPRAGSASARRFEREVALTAKLEHPSIVPLYDSGTTQDGRPYYVMRRVSGRPLDELMGRSRKLEDRLALLPALQSAIDAVAHAHRRGVIHRDLKPANILVGDLGETVVIDWGLAKVVGEDDDAPAAHDALPSDSLQTQIGSVFGTPGFMAPEQARGDEMGPGGDVYALGATLYQLLAGTPPHAGPSATAVIEKTLKSQMVPLAEISPGAPAELVTIVNKALSPEPAQRYPHAGALGEDLRRFLTGQLVAAHRYTAMQRILRFARRHRAALAVGVLALVALAVLAIVSVKRIVHERDAANHARAEAIAGKQAAEKANRELAVRHDALLVARARARIDLNPTEALATLKHLPAGSTQLDEARAVAQAAMLRGVTWAMESTLELTTIAEMSTDTRQLLQVSRDGMVRIWDLDRRKLELARPFPTLTRALWIAGGKVLVTHEASAPAVLDPVTNLLENTTMPPISFAAANLAGDRVVFHGAGGAGTFDTQTRTVKMLTIDKVSDVGISGDGATLTYTTAKETVFVDAAGTVLAKLPAAARVAFSPAGYAAALVDGKLLEARLGPRPTFAPVPPPPEPENLLLDIAYQDRELVMMTGRIAIWAWNGARTYMRGGMTNVTGGLKLADTKYILLASSDNKVHFLERSSKGTVQLPANLQHPRMVTRANSTKVLVVAEGIILGFDLEALRPRVIGVEPDAQVVFVGDDTLLAGRMVSQTWEWIDLETDQRTRIELDALGPIMAIDVDPAGRALLSELGPRGTRVYLLERGSPKVKLVVEGKGAWGRLVPGNALFYTAGDPKIFGIVDSGEPRELVKVAGVPDGGAPCGHRKAVIHSSEGELVRVDLGTGAVERTTVALGTAFDVQGESTTGRVVIAEDDRLLIWDRAVTELAKLDKPIKQITLLPNLVAATLRDNETWLVDMQPGRPPVRSFPPGRSAAVASSDGRVMVAIGNAEQLDVLEVPQRTRWTVPQYYQAYPMSSLAISPTRRRVLQHAMHSLVIWQLPLAPSQDFAQWLDEQTNATVDGAGALLWPWQKPDPE